MMKKEKRARENFDIAEDQVRLRRLFATGIRGFRSCNGVPCGQKLFELEGAFFEKLGQISQALDGFRTEVVFDPLDVLLLDFGGESEQ